MLRGRDTTDYSAPVAGFALHAGMLMREFNVFGEWTETRSPPGGDSRDVYMREQDLCAVASVTSCQFPIFQNKALLCLWKVKNKVKATI